MKKKICIIVAILCALLSLSGCDKKVDPTSKKADSASEQINQQTNDPDLPQVDYNTVYNSLLEEFYYMIKYANIQGEVKEGFWGAVEAAKAFEDEALSKIGYLIEDINSDGIKELLIGISDEGEYAYTKNDLYAVYTLVVQSPTLVVESMGRGYNSLMDGGKIFGYGSNGAAFREFGEYSLEEEAKLKCSDFNFSYDIDGDYTNIGFIHNKNGSSDVNDAGSEHLTQDEFEAREAAFVARTVKLEFTPFSTFTPTGDGSEYFNGEMEGEPLFMTINGNWISNVAGAENWVLNLDLYSDGSASYRCGINESEYLVHFRGSWKPSSETTAITLEMNDEYEGGSFNGEFIWNIYNDSLTLMHKSGDTFIYGMDGATFTFHKK